MSGRRPVHRPGHDQDVLVDAGGDGAARSLELLGDGAGDALRADLRARRGRRRGGDRGRGAARRGARRRPAPTPATCSSTGGGLALPGGPRGRAQAQGDGARPRRGRGGVGDGLGRRDDARRRTPSSSRSRRTDPAREAVGELARPRRGWGARTIEVGPERLDRRARRSSRSPRPRPRTTRRCRPCRPSPCSPSRSPALRGANPDRPDWIERYHSQGLRHILGAGGRPADDPDRPRRRGQRGVHAQPARRHPRLPGAARRGARAPRHRPGPAARPRSGWRPGRPTRSARRPRSRAPPRPARGAHGRRLRDQHDPGRRRPGDPDRLRHPGPLRPAVHDQRHDQRRRRAARAAHDPGRARDRGATWPRSAPTRCSSTTRTRWAMLVRAVDDAIGVPDRRACATPCTGPSTRSPATSGVPPAEVDALSAGVNHLAWITAARAPGPRPVPGPRARSCDAGRVPDDDLVRADLFRRFGIYPTESSEHHAEYNPWFIPKGPGRAVPRPDRRVPRRGSRTTSTSTPTRSAGSTPASRSRSSAAASTPR